MPLRGLADSVKRMAEKPLRLITHLKPVRYVLGLIWLGFIVYPLVANAKWPEVQLFYLTENYISVDNWAKRFSWR